MPSTDNDNHIRRLYSAEAAAGYADCFQSGLLRVTHARKLDIAGIRVHARVSIGPAGDGGVGLAVTLDLEARSSSATQCSRFIPTG